VDSGFSGDETGRDTGAFGVLRPDLRRLRAKERLFQPCRPTAITQFFADCCTIIGCAGIVSSGSKENAM
jgi:hypothetical protein